MKTNSIESLKEFAHEFISHFVSSHKSKKTTVSLFEIQQRKDKSLRASITWFNKECIRVEDLIVFSVIMALLKGTRNRHFKRSLSKSRPKTLTELRL